MASFDTTWKDIDSDGLHSDMDLLLIFFRNMTVSSMFLALMSLMLEMEHHYGVQL